MTMTGGGSAELLNVTFVENRATWGSGIARDSQLRTAEFANLIISYGIEGEGLWDVRGTARLSCCDIYGNDGGDWVGAIAEQLGADGNFSACPSFCNLEHGDLHLCDESPCAPGNHPDSVDCGLIGAWDVGCVCGPSATESSTWGAIKSVYR